MKKYYWTELGSTNNKNVKAGDIFFLNQTSKNKKMTDWLIGEALRKNYIKGV